MFCPKCGNKVTGKYCAKCGWCVDSMKNHIKENGDSDNPPTPKPAPAPAPKPTPAPEPKPAPAPTPKPAPAPTTKPTPAPEPAPAKIPAKKETKEKTKSYENNPKSKGNLAKGIKIFVSLVIISALIGGGVYFYLFYTSDSYKIETAEKYISSGEYSKAIDKLADVEDNQAEALLYYIDVLEAKKSFLENIDYTTMIFDENDKMFDYASDFRDAVNEIDESGKVSDLPDEEKKEVQYYIDVLDKLDSICNKEEDDGNIFESKYINPQNIFLNRPIKNREKDFTLTSLQYNIDVSKAGVESLEKWFSKTITDFSNSENKFKELNKESCPTELSTFYYTTQNFIDACNEEISSEEKNMEEYLKKFKMDENLHVTNPDSSYSSYVCAGLNEVVTIDDAIPNAKAFKNTYYIEMLAYCLNND